MLVLVLSVAISFIGTLLIIKNPDMIWYPLGIGGIKENLTNLAILQVTAFIVAANLLFIFLTRVIFGKNILFFSKLSDAVRMITIAVVPIYLISNFRAFRNSFEHFSKSPDSVFFAIFLGYMGVVCLMVVYDYIHDFAREYEVRPVLVAGLLSCYVTMMSALPFINKIL